MIYTVDGNRCDLLTISSFKHVSSEEEPNLSDLYPDNESRARQFDTDKQIVFVTARVHPGETPAAHICCGVIDFLTSNDPRAQALRDAFVFKVVPMLNPDGVVLGNYRCNMAGVDLNRQYATEHARDVASATAEVMQMGNSLGTAHAELRPQPHPSPLVVKR